MKKILAWPEYSEAMYVLTKRALFGNKTIRLKFI